MLIREKRSSLSVLNGSDEEKKVYDVDADKATDVSFEIINK